MPRASRARPLLARRRERVNLPVFGPVPTLCSMRFDHDSSDPPSPLAVIRGFLGTALLLTTLALVVLFFSTGHVDKQLGLTVGLLWLVWGVASDLVGRVFQPLLGFLGGQLLGGADSGPPLNIDLTRETAMLEQLMAN